MSRCKWIVCERRPRWATALRTAAARKGTLGMSMPRLIEVRTLFELTGWLEACSASVVLIEVHRSNIGDVLAWLVEAETRFPTSRFVAALDSDLVRQSEYGGLGDLDNCRLACDALVEAGAADIADSPRRLRSVLDLACRHAESRAKALARLPTENLSARSAAWASLPWQGE